MKVLAISASPRLKGNSDLLLRKAVEAAQSGGADVEYIRLAGLDIAPCTECCGCYKTGKCVINDDYQPLYQKLIDADRLIFATPIFFMAVSSNAKIFIDRCQCLWAAKYVLKKSFINPEKKDRRAMMIAVGGTKGKKMFECVGLTMKYYFDALEMTYQYNLFVNQIDTKGEIEKQPDAFSQAESLARRLISKDQPALDHPLNIEIFGTQSLSE